MGWTSNAPFSFLTRSNASPSAGWEFDGKGSCLVVPQALPGATGHLSDRACVDAYPCTVKQGLLWVKPTPIRQLLAEDGEKALAEDDLPLVEEVEKEDGWVMGTVRSRRLRRRCCCPCPGVCSRDCRASLTPAQITRDIPYDYATLLENVLDVSHVPFTHHGSVGNRKNASDVDLKAS